MTANSTSLSVGSSTQIHIEVQGGRIDTAPRLVQSDGFDVEMAGRSSSFTMSQGRVSQQTTYTFSILARSPGTHTLGPAEAVVDGKRVLSQPLQIEVREAGTRPGGGSASGSADSTDSADSAVSGGDVRWFAQAVVTDDRPFVGESIAYSLDIGNAVPVRGTSWDRPDWGTLTPAPGVEPEQSEQLDIIDGRRYEVTTLLMPLFALEAGATTIQPSVLEVTVPQRSRSLFDLGAGRKFQFASNALELTVRPLPELGKPDDFSGAVGRFQLSGSIDRNRLNAGETATLVLKLNGRGALHKPKINLELPDSVRRYSEQPQRNTKLVSRALRTDVTFREALVPLQPGTITIPPVSFSYFDPSEEVYRTVRTKPITLHVGGTAVVDPAVVARSSQLGRAKEQVEILNDLVSLHSEEDVRGDQRLTISSAAILLALLLPLFGFSSVATVMTRRRRSGTSAGQARARAKAAREAHKVLQRAEKNDDLEAAESAWRCYLTARLNRSGDALSPGDAQAVLDEADCPGELAEQAAGLLESLESVRYGGGSASSLPADLARWSRVAEKEWK